MPSAGGIIPSVTGDVGLELLATIRRAFIPELIIQNYLSDPFLAQVLSSTRYASGGISSITVPVQGSAMTSGQWTDYSGVFNNPGIINAIQDAEFNLKMFLVPIPFLVTEALVEDEHEVVNLLHARVNDASNQIKYNLATAIFNNTGSDTLQLLGLPAAVDDGTNVRYYGGIDRNADTWWESNYTANSPSVTPTRNLMLQYIAQNTKYSGEMVSMGLMGLGTWAQLTHDFTGLERFTVSPGESFETQSSLFQAINVSSVPFFGDPYMPEGELYLLNMKYIRAYIHRMGSFQFVGFDSLLSTFQLGYIGAIFILLELVNVKPKASSHIKGLSYISL